MPYSIYNEDDEKMRVVSRLEEAKQLVESRAGWSYKFFRAPTKQPEQFNFEEAPF